MINEIQKFVEVKLTNFKAFSQFSIRLENFNVVVGPNNAGKSTILAAFRILEAAMRRARAKRPTIVTGPLGQVHGYQVDLKGLSVADENIFHNYNDEKPAEITFSLSNRNKLTLYFVEQGSCVLIADIVDGRVCTTPSMFKTYFNCPIGFVPILGPVEHNEIRYGKEAARLALFNFGAARNFRNIWYHFPDKFDDFREMIKSTWPGMDIEPPEPQVVDGKLRLFMYSPEERRDREIFWSGFGFQVWCQMLTHITQAEGLSLFLIDEPDIYLHSDLQRQLVSILRDMPSDTLIATHSTEILSEAEFGEIVVVNKKKRRAARVKNADQLSDVFRTLGSNLNPVLTQIAKTGRVLFVEGKDFQILGRLAERAGFLELASRRDFAVVPTKGFNPQKIKNLLEGFTAALGFSPMCACVLDRDYRSDKECVSIEEHLLEFCELVKVLNRKEIENYLLVPAAIDKAAQRRVLEKVRRGSTDAKYTCSSSGILAEFSGLKKSYVAAQYSSSRKLFERGISSGMHDSQITEEELARIDAVWREDSLSLIPGKEALSNVNEVLRDSDGINVTAYGIIQCIGKADIPNDLVALFSELEQFAKRV